jgi:hypothetical protein
MLVGSGPLFWGKNVITSVLKQEVQEIFGCKKDEVLNEQFMIRNFMIYTGRKATVVSEHVT